jgi:hypothetical protein
VKTILQRKKLAKQAIVNNAEVNEPYEKLALHVVLQAIDDINFRRNKHNRVGSVAKSVDSIKQGGLDLWLNVISINYLFFLRIIRKHKLSKAFEV